MKKFLYAGCALLYLGAFVHFAYVGQTPMEHYIFLGVLLLMAANCLIEGFEKKVEETHITDATKTRLTGDRQGSIGSQIAQLIDSEPDSWQPWTENILRYKNSELKLVIGRGLMAVKIHDGAYKFSYVEKQLIYKAYKRWRNARLLPVLMKSSY